MKPTPLEIVLGRLVRLGCQPRLVGAAWIAACPDLKHEPGHEQRLLEITESADGDVVIECHERAADAAGEPHLHLVPKDSKP